MVNDPIEELDEFESSKMHLFFSTGPLVFSTPEFPACASTSMDGPGTVPGEAGATISSSESSISTRSGLLAAFTGDNLAEVSTLAFSGSGESPGEDSAISDGALIGLIFGPCRTLERSELVTEVIDRRPTDGAL